MAAVVPLAAAQDAAAHHTSASGAALAALAIPAVLATAASTWLRTRVRIAR
jgi:hypothetical protein